MSRLSVCNKVRKKTIRQPDTHRQMEPDGDIQKRIFLDLILFLSRSTGFLLGLTENWSPSSNAMYELSNLNHGCIIKHLFRFEPIGMGKSRIRYAFKLLRTRSQVLPYVESTYVRTAFARPNHT